MSLEAEFEPRAWLACSCFSVQRRELFPEIRTHVGIALRSPAGTRRIAAAAAVLDAKRLVPEIRTEPVEPDPSQFSRSAAAVART